MLRQCRSPSAAFSTPRPRSFKKFWTANSQMSSISYDSVISILKTPKITKRFRYRNLGKPPPNSYRAHHRNLPITFPRIVADESVFWSTNLPNSYRAHHRNLPALHPRIVADESVFWSTNLPNSHHIPSPKPPRLAPPRSSG